MKRKWIAYFSALLLLTFIRVPEAAPTITSISSSVGGAVNFTGDDTKYLRVTNSSNLNIGFNNFTISWWQKTTSNQFLYPRIMQIGSGNAYTDRFAISEESDGNIYLWINGINITSMPIPSMFDWHHISISRDGYNYTWSLDGVKGGTTNFVSMIPCENCLSKFAEFDTTALDLYLGGGNDTSTGAFIGDLAGFQITEGVRWPGGASFTPPIDFLNPTAGLAFSMYVNATDLVDKSAQNLTITPVGITNSDFSNFSPPVPEPDPSPSPSPSDSPSPSPSPSDSPSPSPSPSDSPSPSPSPSDSPSPSPSPSDSPSPSPSPSDSPSPSPSPSDPGPTITPDPITHEVSVRVRDRQGGRVTAYTDSWSNDANNRATDYEFWVIEDEHYEVHIYPDRGYVVDFLLWNGVEVRDSARWNGSLNFFSGDHLSEDLNIQIFFRLQTLESMVVSEPGNNHVLFGEDFYLRTRIEKFPNNYWGVDGIVMALPVFTANPGEEPIRNICYMDIGQFWDPIDTSTSIDIELPTYSAFLTYFFPSDCQSPRSDLFPEGIPIPNYHNGIFGSDSATVTLALFSQTPEDITDFSTAVETLTVTLGIPPDILSGSVTSADPSKAESGKIYFGDTFTVTASDVGNASFAETVVFLPEASPSGGNPSETACYLGSDVSSDNSYQFPTESELISRCRLTYTHPWEFNRTAEHNFFFFYPDDAYNHGWPLMLTVAAAVAPEVPAPPAPTPPAPVPPTPPTPVEDVKVESTETHLKESVEPEPEKAEPTKPEPVKVEPTKTEKPKTISMKAKACTAQGIWIFTKSGLLQICDEQLKVALATKACTGKSATPTFPWVFKAQRFKPGYTNTKSGLQIYYSVFFYKGLAIAGIDHVSNTPCSNGSVFIDKKSAKKVYEFLKATGVPIWVKNR